MTVYEDWGEAERPDSFPFSAAIAGSVVLVAAGIFVQPHFAFLPFWQLLLAGIGLALLLWLIAWAVTVRHAALAWKFGSLAILLGVGATTAFGGMIAARMQLREDMRTIAEFRVRPDGTPDFTRGAESRGPISRGFIAMTNGIVEDRQRFDKAALGLGLNLLDDPMALTRAPAILGKCGEIEGLEKLAREVYASQRQRIRDFVSGIEKLDLPAEFKAGVRRGYDGTDLDNYYNKLLAANIDMLDQSQAMCIVLARRNWTPQYRMFMFNNAGDLAEFDRIAKRHQAAAAVYNGLQADWQKRADRRQRQLQRTLGY